MDLKYIFSKRIPARFHIVGQLSRAVLLLLLDLAIATPATPLWQAPTPNGGSRQSLSRRDDAFLEDLSRRSFRFFWENADPATGLVRDRARTDGTPHEAKQREVASIAATGFGLTALCIAAERHWIKPRDARERARRALRFLAERMPQEHGWFYHFVRMRTGERVWQSELSSIDTALLLAGVLTVRQYYSDDAEIYRQATTIYQRIDFPWMLNGHSALLSMGWHPETGFIKSRWDIYSEHLILQLVAIGSPTHPITPRAWLAWERTRVTYAGYTYLSGVPPLFIHQYSHAWVDFRGRRESSPPHTDYFANSIAATRANRQFCIDLAREFPGYSANVWGITASDSVKGYNGSWGGPTRDSSIDGTVVPCAAGGSLMFTPDISLPALQTIYQKFRKRVYGRYGFIDAFNPTTGWTNPDVIGIDVGITLLSAENLRSGNVWRWFMRNTEIPHAMRLVGLEKAGPSVRPLRRHSSSRGQTVSRKAGAAARTLVQASLFSKATI